MKAFARTIRGPVERCELNVVRCTLSEVDRFGRLLENVQRATLNVQRSEVLLFDECLFQIRLKAGL